MHKDIAVKLHNISKVYKLYESPKDRLKEALHPFGKKYHKDFFALKNINLEIKKGEVLGIVGVNGAGKSTLLKIIAGVLTPTSGRVTINGRLNAILELSSGLKGEMTGRQNIKLNLQINGIDENVEQLTKEIIEFADIGEHIDQPVKTYSSGMKARLGFGLATSTDPDILIVDEVLAVGDIIFRKKCYTRIENLFKDGKTVIFVSHSAQAVVEFCSNAILLYNREIILEGPSKKVTDYYQKLVLSKSHSKVLDEIKGNEVIVLNEQVKTNQSFNGKFITSHKYFFESLKVTPSILNDTGFLLKAIHILNEKNHIVNRLITNNKYQLYVEAVLNENYDELTFGIAIKNIKGFSVSSSRESISKRGFIKNKTLKFVWDFKCNLLNGQYFIKIDFKNGAEEILYQATDIVTFEVENTFKNTFQSKGGVVDLEQNCKEII